LDRAANNDIFARLDTCLNVVIGNCFAVELIDGDDGTSDYGGVCGITSLNWCTFLVKSSVVMLRLRDRKGCSAEQRDSRELHCEEANS
jgi:hypothetical protein